MRILVGKILSKGPSTNFVHALLEFCNAAFYYSLLLFFFVTRRGGTFCTVAEEAPALRNVVQRTPEIMGFQRLIKGRSAENIWQHLLGFRNRIVPRLFSKPCRAENLTIQIVQVILAFVRGRHAAFWQKAIAFPQGG